jgi:hypothetical protein
MTLDAFRAQKTVVLTTYRRDGRAVDTPIYIAVEDGRAFVRTYRTALKTKRLGRNPEAILWRASNGSRPPLVALLFPKQTHRVGSGVRVRARELAGVEARAAATALTRKYPILNRFVIPWTHRFVYRTTTVHYELTPEPSREKPAGAPAGAKTRE